MFADPTLADAALCRNLGDGLQLRWSTPADVEAIAALLGTVHRPHAEAPLNQTIGARVRMLMRGDNPTMGPGDFAVVQDTAREGQPLVACACLWHHTWEYAGIPLGVGRPEYVATDAAYRRRGLIRAIFAALHARSEALGHQLQAISGIRHYYHQFGYEYALDLDGLRGVYVTQIPAVKAGETDTYHLRPATVADIPQLMALHAQRHDASLLWSAHTERDWRYQIVALAEIGTPEKVGTLQMLTDANDAPIGYVHVALKRWDAQLNVFACETLPGINLRALALPLLRALVAYGQTIPNVENDAPITRIDLRLGRSHPLYDVLGPSLAPYSEPPYAWYIRVADPLGFVRMIAPVLERRLVASSLAGYSGEMKMDWFRGGMRLAFEHGTLTTVEPWQPLLYGEGSDAECPVSLFTQLLCSYRTYDELCAIFPDVGAVDEARLLLTTLFPKMASSVID